MFAPLWFSFVYFRHFTTFTLLMFTYRKVFLAWLTWMTMTRRYCEVFPNNLSLMLVSENHKLLWLLIKYVNPRKRKGNFFNIHLVREFMQTQIPVEELKKHANRFTTNEMLNSCFTRNKTFILFLIISVYNVDKLTSVCTSGLVRNRHVTQVMS